VTVQDDVKEKLDTLLKRRCRKYNARKTHSHDAWVALEDFAVHFDDGNKLLDIIIDDLGDDKIRMSFKVSNVDHVNMELITVNETCVDVNSGEACDKWIDVY